MKPTQQSTPKQTYHTPQLRQYGTINALTQAAPGSGDLDGAGLTANPNRTA